MKPICDVFMHLQAEAWLSLVTDTGYGGTSDYSAWSMGGVDNKPPANKHLDQEKINKARQREDEKDKEVAAALRDVKSLLDLASGTIPLPPQGTFNGVTHVASKPASNLLCLGGGISRYSMLYTTRMET